MKTSLFISKNILPLIGMVLIFSIVTLVTYNCVAHGISSSSSFSALGD